MDKYLVRSRAQSRTAGTTPFTGTGGQAEPIEAPAGFEARK
jgi:hypothetical protein